MSEWMITYYDMTAATDDIVYNFYIKILSSEITTNVSILHASENLPKSSEPPSQPMILLWYRGLSQRPYKADRYLSFRLITTEMSH